MVYLSIIIFVMGLLKDKVMGLKNKVEENISVFSIPGKEKRMKELEILISESYSEGNINNASNLLIEQSRLKKEVEKWYNLRAKVDNLLSLSAEVEELNDENMTNDVLKEVKKLEEIVSQYEIERFFDSEVDSSNCFINIHPGAGGTESCDWASMLFRMYTRFFEKKGFKYEVVDFLPGEEAGIKDVTLYVQGEFAFGYLKSETGIHRLVRISPFDASKRRHTSFCAVHVMPEIPSDIDMMIDPSEIKVEVFRAGGKGGQHVNKTESAVRITHIPTGIVVSIQNERSQIQNKEIAMKILKSKLYEIKEKERQKKIDEISGEKKDISWGNQIRSYVLHPYNSIKDHRTDLETSDTQSVLDGELDMFINAYIKWSYLNKSKV
jgi:peptide chain release factor 2